jgi:hypothetical protein
VKRNELASLLGERNYLTALRLNALVCWLLEHVTPAKWWSGHVVPGKIIVVTNSAEARRAVDESLQSLQSKRFFKVLKVVRMHEQHSKPVEQTFYEPVLGSWALCVPRGSERAIVLELELAVAARLERAGNYEGIDKRLSLLFAKSAISANQARRVRPSGNGFDPSAPVTFTPVHDDYIRLLAAEAQVSGGVDVAIFDTAVNPMHLPSPVAARFHMATEHMSAEAGRIPPCAHGAVTAAIVGAISPASWIEGYTVTGMNEIVDESSIINSLMSTQARVLCMPIKMEFPRRWREDRESVIEKVLRGVGNDRVIVVSSGNRRGRQDSDSVSFPGTCGTVLT